MPNIGTTSKLVLAFVTLILGAVLIGTLATQGLAVTDYTAIADESHVLTAETQRNTTNINGSVTHTLTNAPTGWKADDCPITEFVLTNSSGTALTVTTDYVLTAAAGTWVFVDNAALNNTIDVATNQTLASYSYCGDDYMNLGWGRTSINLVSGFFAIAILMVSVGLFYSVAKDYGIIGR